jgi:hypothetical protein
MAQAIGLVLSGTLIAGAAMAGETPKAAPTQTVSVQGVQVAIDPATGRLREPTAAERAKLSQALLQRSASGSKSSLATGGRPRTEAEARSTFVKTRLSSGATVTRVTVPQNLMNSVVAERLPDGSVSVHHDDGQAHTNQAKAPEVTR